MLAKVLELRPWWLLAKGREESVRVRELSH